MDESPLRTVLEKAARDAATVSVTVVDTDPVPGTSALLGRVVMVDGKVAWATSQQQSETLGAALLRTRQITQEQLDLAAVVVRANRGQKRVGAALEELGFITRVTLRQAVMVHAREALRLLLSMDRGRIATQTPQGKADETLLFDLAEVLPATAASVVDDAATEKVLPEQAEALLRLFSVPGYAASAVVAANGEILTGHVARAGTSLAPLGLYASGLLELADRLSATQGLGDAGVLAARCSGGAALTSWLDSTKRALLVVVVTDPGSQSETRATLERALPACRAWLAHGAGPAYYRALVQASSSSQSQAQALRLAVTARLGQLRSQGEENADLNGLEQALGLLSEGRIQEAAQLLSGAKSLWGSQAERRNP